MHITQSYLTNSSCFKKNLARDDSRYRIFQDRGPRGIMLHSVGCPQPDPAVFVRTWNCDYNACVHAFVGADEVYQTLPWNYRGWHCGGDANNTHIGVEMTEPGCIQYITGSNFSCSDFPRHGRLPPRLMRLPSGCSRSCVWPTTLTRSVTAW